MERKWLDNYGQEDNYNDSKVSLPKGFVGDGIINGPQWNSPAWGGQFQIGGSLPGISGIMYSRESSNKPIIKVAQDGTNVDYSKLPYDENDIKGFYNKMISSPWYKNRLIKNGYDDQYSIGVDKVIENRLKRVNDAKLDNVQKNDGVLNQMYRFITSGELIETGSGSYYNPDTGNITMVESQMNKHKAHPRTILSHEYGHPEVQGGISRIEEEMLSQFNPTPIKKLTEHDKKPSENKSDINSLRYNLYKAKIFDPSTGNYKTKSKKFEQSLFEKIKDDAAVKRLRNNYGDKQLINLINTVATNENNELVPIAKNGVIKDNNGYWNPDNWGKVVEIDSNDITMKGVNQPLLGISDEGDVQYMEPNKDYKFKGKKVTEFPIAQNGIKTFYNDYINSPKYRERLKLQNYSNPDKVISDRKKNLLNAKVNIIKDKGIFTANNTGSYYHPSTNIIDYDELDLKLYPGVTPEDIIVHETSHATGSLFPKNKSNLTLNKKEATEITSRNKNKQEHEKNPEEAKADMDVLRYHLKKDRLYDTGKEEFTPELYNRAKKKYKNNKTIKRFFDRFSDKDAVYLMNSIANNDNYDEFIPIARNGINNLDENSLQQLDQLTNFTNYNKLSNGGWLDKF